MKLRIFYLVFIGITLVNNVSAQTVKPKPENIQAAINQALKSGKLTPQQTTKLKARSAMLQKSKNINKVLTPAEKAKLVALAKQRNNANKKQLFFIRLR